jgi:hypothetical protein
MGRIMNVAIQAMQDLPPYHFRGTPIEIQYPRQTNVDDVIRYRKYKARLTRVKKAA